MIDLEPYLDELRTLFMEAGIDLDEPIDEFAGIVGNQILNESEAALLYVQTNKERNQS